MDTPENTKGIKRTSSGRSGEITDAGSMDKIRDILFGNQARDYENRFAGMEEQLAREIGSLKEELAGRIDALESYVKQEIKDINARIKTEADERAESDRKIQAQLNDAVETLNKKLVAEEEKLALKSSELREQILAQSKQLSAEILSKYEQAELSLKQAATRLDDAKVNRSDLSGFFLDIAMRLSGDDDAGSSSE